MLRFPKPARGSLILAREAQQAEARASEKREKALAKRRDGGCRWPEDHKCRGVLEAAHLRDASLGGECVESNLVVLCSWLHRRGPESIHGKELLIEADSAEGANGPLSFWRQLPSGGYFLIARESSRGVVERD